jgi:hypothetical protein
MGYFSYCDPLRHFGDRARRVPAPCRRTVDAGRARCVIDLVAYEPTCGDLISGTGGLRKIRIGRKGMGKRGGARVIYFFHDVEIPILLVAIYAKNEKGDLTPAEKKEFAGLVKNFVSQWRKRK